VTAVERDGAPVAALVHDPSLAGEERFVRAVGRTAVLWLERARMEADRNARMVELRESRARLVEATDAERRRIERDLHDGAQQRLAGLLLHSKLRRRAVATPAEAEALLEDLERGLGEALAELRALAAGILPPVLTDHGLPAAVEELAARCPVLVAVREENVGRLPARVEAAGYFVVAEALATVMKHARADRVVVRLASAGGVLCVEIADDGVGLGAAAGAGANDAPGAHANGGSGLRGLADRVGALDGTLTCTSTDGGTVVRAEIPCAS
jgi:signal transduction histidine kinase